MLIAAVRDILTRETMAAFFVQTPSIGTKKFAFVNRTKNGWVTVV